MERCPTKSVIFVRAETVGSVGFMISSCVVGSSPIFWASLFFSLSSRSGLNNAIEMQFLSDTRCAVVGQPRQLQTHSYQPS